MKFGIGQSVTRSEDPRFITGNGRYTDDINIPDQSFAYILRSPIAFADILSIDAGDAEAVEGVIAVFTGHDYQADGIGALRCHVIPPEAMLTGPPVAPPRPALQTERVLYVGEPVAIVIAETYDIAKQAAERIDVEYDERQAVISIDQAMATEAEQIWPGTVENAAFVIDVGDRDQTDTAFKAAHHVTELSLFNNRITANSIETRGAIGQYAAANGSFTLHSSTQRPHTVRSDMAAVFGVAESKIRVISEDVGGGFGMKGAIYAEEILVLWAAKKTGRPVKWRCERTEAFVSDFHGRDQTVTAELALGEDGKILGLRVLSLFNQGAYMASAGGVPVKDAANLLSGVYDIPAIHSIAKAVYSNTTPTHPYRGAGRPEAAYIIERLIDQAAGEMNIDPVTLRRRNFIKPADMPYQTALFCKYDCGDFETIMDQALDLADWDGFDGRKRASAKHGLLRGRGLSVSLESAAEFNEQMEIRFDPSGSATIISGTHSHGQGHETAYAQLVADWLGIPFDKIGFVQGDTDAVAFGRGTFASRSISIGGGALRRAADQIIDRGIELAAHMLEAEKNEIEFDGGLFAIKGTNRNVHITQVAQAAFNPFLPDHLGLGLQGVASFAASGSNFPNSCQIAEVEIDPETGEIRMDRFYCMCDVGTVINPLLLEGQMVGGIVQGVGQALLEDIRYDAESGQLLSGSFMDYCMPRADNVPPMIIETNEDIPTKTNPLGAKGAGECGTVGAAPTVISAILDALAERGVRDITMPATPARIWQALQDAKP